MGTVQRVSRKKPFLQLVEQFLRKTQIVTFCLEAIAI
jgi:hypothetical protein